MRKKIATALITTIAIIVTVSLLLAGLIFPQIPHKYEKTISRNTTSAEEDTALAAAENLNYSPITGKERFEGSSDPQDYLNPGTYLTYTYANYIDNQTLNYYQTRYDNLQNKEYPKQIGLNYQANVSKYSNFRIYNSPPPQGANWHNTTVISIADGIQHRQDPAQFRFYYRNQTGYQTINQGYDLNFTNCYVIEMKFTYYETYGIVAGYSSNIYQIVILDENFLPLVVGVEAKGTIS
jgi:hypothetical protein